MTDIVSDRVDIYFYEAFEEEEKELRKYLDPRVRAEFTWKAIQESGHSEPPCALISTRTQSIIPAGWGNKLNGILSRSTGYNHLLEYEHVTKAGIEYGYLPLYCHRSVAEQALLLWMSLLRNLNGQQHKFNSFNRDGLTGAECKKKILLVVGVGNIGYQIVKIGRGMGMDVYGVDLVRKHKDVKYSDIDRTISKADIVVASMNLTAINRGYFNYSLLSQAKVGAIFINIARGELSPMEDLLKLVEEGHLGGVGLDVYEDESDLAVSLRSGQKSSNKHVQAVLRLHQYPNVILTPHNAFNTREAVIRKSEQSAQQVQHFLKTGKFVWPVDKE